MLKRWRWVFPGCAVICAVVGLIVGGLATFMVAESFEGSVTIEVLPECPDDLHAVQRPAGVAPEEFVEPWILKEIGSITDRKSFNAVIGRLDLHHRWRTDWEGAATVLEKSVAVRSLRGTPVVAIRVRHPDQVSVGWIARELALNYQDRRLSIGKRAATGMAGKLRAAIREQEQKVDECRMTLAEVERTMKKNLNLGATETLLHIPESRAHADARRELADAEGVLHALKFKLIEQDNADVLSCLRALSEMTVNHCYHPSASFQKKCGRQRRRSERRENSCCSTSRSTWSGRPCCGSSPTSSR